MPSPSVPPTGLRMCTPYSLNLPPRSLGCRAVPRRRKPDPRRDSHNTIRQPRDGTRPVGNSRKSNGMHATGTRGDQVPTQATKVDSGSEPGAVTSARITYCSRNANTATPTAAAANSQPMRLPARLEMSAPTAAYPTTMVIPAASPDQPPPRAPFRTCRTTVAAARPIDTTNTAREAIRLVREGIPVSIPPILCASEREGKGARHAVREEDCPTVGRVPAPRRQLARDTIPRCRWSCRRPTRRR